MRYTQKHPQYTYTKRDVYYFSKVIPSDIRHHYSKPRITQSLKTKSTQKAASAAKLLSGRLDDISLSFDNSLLRMVLIGLMTASRILRYYVSLLSYISFDDIHLVITLLISPFVRNNSSNTTFWLIHITLTSRY
jgi:hypothetical protein